MEFLMAGYRKDNIADLRTARQQIDHSGQQRLIWYRTRETAARLRMISKEAA